MNLLFRMALGMMFLLNAADIQAAIQWVQRSSGPADSKDNLAEMSVDANRDIVITGTSRASSGSHMNIVTTRFDSDGLMLWEREFDGGGDDTSKAMFMDSSGNVVVAGTTVTQDFLTGIVVLKYDSSGNQVWVATFGTEGLEAVPNHVLVDPSGNIYVAGTGGRGRFPVLLKFDTAGTLLWSISDSSRKVVSVDGLSLDASNNPIFAGALASQEDTQIAVFKYDSFGNEVWHNVYTWNKPSGQTYQDRPVALKMGASGEIYVAGSSLRGNKYELVLVHLDAAGNQLWDAAFHHGGDGNNFARDLETAPNGSIYLSGVISTGSPESVVRDILLLNFSANGDLQWDRIFSQSTTSDDLVWKLIAGDNSDVYLTGASGEMNDYDLLVLKYNQEGSLLWEQGYDGEKGNDSGSRIAIDASGGILVAGESSGGTAAGIDRLLVKFSDVSGAGERGVQLTSPEAESVFEAKTDIPLQADIIGMDPGDLVVEFYAGVKLLGKDTSSPYEHVWRKVKKGEYELSARVRTQEDEFLRSEPVRVRVMAPLPEVNIHSSRLELSEGNPKAARVVFTRKKGNMGKPLIVEYEIQGSASPGIDFQKIPSRMIIPPNTLSAVLMLRAKQDNEQEGSETVSVQISNGDNRYVIGSSSSVSLTIRDDD